MPRRVVPIFVPLLEAASSRMPSSSRCSDRISVALSAMRRLSGVIAMPCLPSLSISAISACGSMTTPLPMTASLPGRTTPEGRSDSL
ncbi:hypothetical protein D9M72_543420 [compost metagenome]